ncbi:MAG TPA: hypothetical protein VJT67_07365 [Longimicrobiaceae bacterium]|nr:hypothetical protein [Longimicrobiaceae bacterium]
MNTGFSQPTFIYLSRLVPARPSSLLRKTGKLVDEMPRLQTLLRRALGIGMGRRGWRGRVVQLADARAESIGYSHAIVVTEPGYSAHERYQTIVPIDNLEEFEPVPQDLQIVDGADWAPTSGRTWHGVLVAIADVHSVFHPRDVHAWIGAVVDDVTMRRIDAALESLFSL